MIASALSIGKPQPWRHAKSVRRSVIVGSPSTVLERLIEAVRRFRIGNLHVMLQFGSMPRQVAMVLPGA